MKSSNFFALAIGAYAIVGAVQAQQLTGTLKKIRESGSITFGTRDASIPFSYLDDKQSTQGYSIDLCKKIADAVQKHLDMNTLKIIMNPVTGATRIPLMANGTIDLECASTTNNIERQKVVSFSPTTFVTGTRLLARKTSNINSPEDLKGKSAVSVSGSNNLEQIMNLNKERNLGINVIGAKDLAEAFLMVETGRATAWVADDISLAAYASNSKSPGDYAISREALSVEPYGIMLRRDDPEFKKIVDSTIIGLFKSGEIHRIYAKWFQSPLPPKGNSMNWPMSIPLQTAIANPTDSGDPAAYAVMPGAQKNK